MTSRIDVVASVLVTVVFAALLLGSCKGSDPSGPHMEPEEPTVDPEEPAQPIPTAITMVSGNLQEGKAGVWGLSDPLVVRVTDAHGDGVEGVQVTWNVASGAGRLDFEFHGDDWLCDSMDGCTDTLGRSYARLVPSTIGTTTVTAELEGLEGSPVTFTTDVTIMLIFFGPDLGVSDDPVFVGPHGYLGPTAGVEVPVGTPVEWFIGGDGFFTDVWDGAAHIVSTSEPPGGESFEFSTGSCWQWWESRCEEGIYFEFVPNVAGTWEFEDLLSGATGTLTAH
jgi:hypothetical protein